VAAFSVALMPYFLVKEYRSGGFAYLASLASMRHGTSSALIIPVSYGEGNAEKITKGIHFQKTSMIADRSVLGELQYHLPGALLLMVLGCRSIFNPDRIPVRGCACHGMPWSSISHGNVPVGITYGREQEHPDLHPDDNMWRH
jgi:hypothetical protein